MTSSAASIPKATPVLISIYVVHRAPVWGGDPNASFAAGRHLCAGKFSGVEMTVALAAIVQRYSFAVPDAVGESARITLVPDREIELHLEPR